MEEFKLLLVFYISEGRRKREVGADVAVQHRPNFITTNRCRVLHFPVDPCSYPHLWSWSTSSDRKKRSRIHVSEMSFLRRMCGLSEIWWEAWSCRRRSEERRCIIRSQMRRGRYLVRPSLWGLEDGLKKMLNKQKGPGRGKTQPPLFRLLPIRGSVWVDGRGLVSFQKVVRSLEIKPDCQPFCWSPWSIIGSISQYLTQFPFSCVKYKPLKSGHA